MPVVNGSPVPASHELSNGDIVSFEQPSAEQRLLAATTGSPLQLLGSGGVPQALPAAAPGNGRTRPGERRAAQYVRDREAPPGAAAHARLPPPAGWRPCPLCQPLPGDELVGARAVAGARDEGAHMWSWNSGGDAALGDGTVHRQGAECRALNEELSEGRRLVRGAGELASGLQPESEASIVIFGRDRRGMLVDVSTVVSTVASNILDVSSETRVQGGARPPH